MALGKVFGVFVSLSLAATGASIARNVSHGIPDEKANLASLVTGSEMTAKSGQRPASAARHATPQAPIVMGRSASIHHKTKLHHVRAVPLDSGDTSPTTGGS
jgi:hypothetical protein